MGALPVCQQKTMKRVWKEDQFHDGVRNPLLVYIGKLSVRPPAGLEKRRLAAAGRRENKARGTHKGEWQGQE